MSSTPHCRLNEASFPLSVLLGTFCFRSRGHQVSLLVWRAVRKDAISSLSPFWVACIFLGGASNGLDDSGGDGDEGESGSKVEGVGVEEEGVVAGLDISSGTPPQGCTSVASRALLPRGHMF